MKDFLFGFVVCLLLLAPRQEAAASSHPDAPKRWAILVGNNRGSPSQKPLRYAETDALRIARILQEIGGLETNRLHLLRGSGIHALQRLWKRVEAEIHASKRASPFAPLQLFFYFSGHADAKALYLGNETLAWDILRRWIQNSPATVRIAILDTCQSAEMIRKGSPSSPPSLAGRSLPSPSSPPSLAGRSLLPTNLAHFEGSQAKGARRIPQTMRLPPQIQKHTTQGEAIITSSGLGEDAHEIDQIRSSIFTHYLISGLRGSADSDHDGRISLEEAYRYAYSRTLSHTIFLSSGVQHPSFRHRLHGHGHLILTWPGQAASRLHIGANQQGAFYVLHPQQHTLLAEITKAQGEDISLGLAEGRYLIVHRDSQAYRFQTIGLKKGQAHRLEPSQMQRLSYQTSAHKGLSWLTHPAPSPPSPPANSPLLLAGHLTLAAALIAGATAGLFYGLAHKYHGEARQSLELQHSSGLPDPSLLQTSSSFQIAALSVLLVSLSSVAATTTLYLLHYRKTSALPTAPPSLSPLPPSASPLPPSSSTSLQGSLLFVGE